MTVFIALCVLLVVVWAWWRFVYFHRNPDRICPPGDDLVCPADGRIIYSEVVDFGAPLSGLRPSGTPAYFDRVRSTWNLSGDWSVIATYLSIFDVHFVRSPLSGRVRYRNIPVVGRNLSMEWPMVSAILKRPLPLGRRGYCDKNEILCVSIEGDIPVVLVLMADWWIRQIETFVPEGGWIERGQVLAHIRMGSQVDVWIPSERATFARSHFDTVLAGETILGVKTPDPPSYKQRIRFEVAGVFQRE